MSEWSLPHWFRVEKAMTTVAAFEATDHVIPLLPMEFSAATFWAGKPNGGIQLWQLLPPEEIMTIVASLHKMSIPRIAP